MSERCVIAIEKGHISNFIQMFYALRQWLIDHVFVTNKFANVRENPIAIDDSRYTE